MPKAFRTKERMVIEVQNPITTQDLMDLAGDLARRHGVHARVEISSFVDNRDTNLHPQNRVSFKIRTAEEMRSH